MPSFQEDGSEPPPFHDLDGLVEEEHARVSGVSTVTPADRMSLQVEGSSWQTFVWDSFALMFGGTQLGYAMGQMGWGWGLTWVLFSALSTWLSGHLLGQLCLDTGAASYPELGQIYFGNRGRQFTLLCQWSGYFLGGVVQIAFIGATWDQAIGSYTPGVCQWLWMIITTGILIPVIQVPSFSQFGNIALACTVAAIFLVAVYLGQVVEYGRYTHICYNQWSMNSMMANICNMAFTFSGHGTFPEQIREMREPKDFGKAFDMLYALAIPFYVACAVAAFWAFGNMNSANWLENLKDTMAVKIGIFSSLVSTMPVIALGQVVLLLQVELALGVLPTDWMVNRSTVQGKWAQKVRGIPPVVFRLAFRTCYLLAMLFLAELLIGAGLAIFVNIAGSLGLTATTYWLPYIFYLKGHGDKLPWSKKLLYLVNALGGLFITMSGLYFNIKDLVQSKDFEFFHETTCKEGAYFWGNHMWESNLDNSTNAYQTLVVDCCQKGETCGD